MLETEAYSFYLCTIITEVPLWTFPTTPFMAPLTKGVFFFFLIRDLLPKTKNPTNLFTIVNPPKSMTTKEHSCLKLLEKMLMHPLNFGVVALYPLNFHFNQFGTWIIYICQITTSICSPFDTNNLLNSLDTHVQKKISNPLREDKMFSGEKITKVPNLKQL